MERRRGKLVEITSESDKDWGSLVKECQHYAESCGLVLKRDNADGSSRTEMGSLTLLPSKFPASAYRQALAVQPIYNELYLKVGLDYQFMKDSLASTVASDEFMRKLWDIYETVKQEGSGNPISVDIMRADYMYHLKDGKFCIAQIEVNTVAASMAALSTKAIQTHRYLERVLNDTRLIDGSKFPTNNGMAAIAESLVKCWELYNKEGAVVLMLLDSTEGNFSDIRHIEYEMINQNVRVKVIVKTSNLLHNSTSLTEDRKLMVDEQEVAVVYFRNYYAPDQFEERDWSLRLMLERSQAIKAPSIASQLAGSKKIQQALTLPGMLERFLSPQKCVQVRDSFVGIYTLTEDAVEAARKTPAHYVLKPNREGGGNNYYGEDIITKLDEIHSTEEKDSYILMERVHPPLQYNCRVSNNGSQAQCYCVATVSELGIYGTIIGSHGETIHSSSAGYLLRTKPADSDEGGYYTGNSSLDTPYLLEDNEMIEELRDTANNCC